MCQTRNDRDTQFGIRSGIAAFDTVERVFRRERGEDTIGVVEGILEILDQLSFCFRRIVPALLAVVGRLLALKFVEEGELSAGDVHLWGARVPVVSHTSGHRSIQHSVDSVDSLDSSENQPT